MSKISSDIIEKGKREHQLLLIKKEKAQVNLGEKFIYLEFVVFAVDKFFFGFGWKNSLGELGKMHWMHELSGVGEYIVKKKCV